MMKFGTDLHYAPDKVTHCYEHLPARQQLIIHSETNYHQSFVYYIDWLGTLCDSQQRVLVSISSLT